LQNLLDYKYDYHGAGRKEEGKRNYLDTGSVSRAYII
jgi:hypothetical protein